MDKDKGEVDSTTMINSISHLLKGERRLKRINLAIRMKKNPEHLATGYALINELGSPLFSFFCTEKYAVDEELILDLTVWGKALQYEVTMSHLHEQISSGRIMSALPSDDEPFPVRKFYRCFAKIVVNPLEKTTPESTETPVTETVVGAPLEVVPDLKVA